MFDLPQHQPQPQHNTSGEPAFAAQRPRRAPGEVVEGWVIAEITPYPRRLRPVISSNAGAGVESFTPDHVKTLEEFYLAHYAPPAAQFVLAVVEYPSGPISRWGSVRWPAVEILARSPHEWPALAGGALPETPELRRWVDGLARQALAQGWEPAGHGQLWCSLRFRQRYASLGGILRWK